MAQFPCLPLWTDAYLADTTHLTTVEHGSYLLLLMAMWRSKEKSLPNDDVFLARICKLTSSQWKRIRPVLEPFFDVNNGRLSNGRLSDEAIAVKQKSKNQSSKAKARWLKNKNSGNAVASSGHSQNDASLNLTLNHIDNTKDSIIPPIVPHDDFESLWVAWQPFDMVKGNKQDALKAYTKIINKGESDHETLIRRAADYCQQCHTIRSKTKHVSSWLNGGSWKHESEPIAYTATKPNGHAGKRDEFADTVRAAYSRLDADQPQN